MLPLPHSPACFEGARETGADDAVRQGRCHFGCQADGPTDFSHVGLQGITLYQRGRTWTVRPRAPRDLLTVTGEASWERAWLSHFGRRA